MSERAQASVWELPLINGPVITASRRAEELDAIEREAFDKGHAAGHAAGLAVAQHEQQRASAELQQRVLRMGNVLDCLARPLAELDEQVQRQLAQLAGAIARQIVRRELKTHPDQIVAVIRETVALLPMAARDVRVHLHPDDAVLVRERLSDVEADRAWTVTQDPMLTRGGCRVSSDNSSIDATVERRLGTAIATILGDERMRAPPASDGAAVTESSEAGA